LLSALRKRRQKSWWENCVGAAGDGEDRLKTLST
jgi:hypothetical protein